MLDFFKPSKKYILTEITKRRIERGIIIRYIIYYFILLTF